VADIFDFMKSLESGAHNNKQYRDFFEQPEL